MIEHKTKRIRLIIVEANKILREGIRVMVEEQKDIWLVAALGDRIKILDKIRDLKPEVLLLDLALVNHNSLELVKSLKKEFPKLKMIMMALLPIQSDIKQFIEEGVTGFIQKDSITKDFINTIKAVAKGEKCFPSQLQGSLISEIVKNTMNELSDSKVIDSIRMTQNEKKIIELISSGFTDKEIAKKLILNVSIIKSHKKNILEKMLFNKHLQLSGYRNSGQDAFNSSDVKQNKAKKRKKKTINGFSKKKTNLNKN
jgi:DNA-binding NarL/FixJ family response regulator